MSISLHDQISTLEALRTLALGYMIRLRPGRNQLSSAGYRAARRRYVETSEALTRLEAAFMGAEDNFPTAVRGVA